MTKGYAAKATRIWSTWRTGAGLSLGKSPTNAVFGATRAIVATGSYAPRGFALEWNVPQGAEEADGPSLIRVVRDQIGHGADPGHRAPARGSEARPLT